MNNITPSALLLLAILTGCTTPEPRCPRQVEIVNGPLNNHDRVIYKSAQISCYMKFKTCLVRFEKTEKHQDYRVTCG
jgi:hypothetical protein